MITYTKTEYESIDDSLIEEALQGEKLVCVSKDNDYIEAMDIQNRKIRDFLNDKYPDRAFRIGQINYHDFGQYREVEEAKQYTYCEDCDNLAEECECE